MIPVAKPYLNELEAKNAYDTILTGWVTQGPKVAEFEEKFAAYVGAKYAIAVSNCTTALHLALIVAGVTFGDEVICPSMSYVATANSIRYTGAKPVFAEVNPFTYNIDVEDVKRKITHKTKAILIVHQIGMPADIDAFKELCEYKNLVLIEDAACSVGSLYKGKRIGSHSDLVCFSFHPRKVITTGDGGMITTGNKQYKDRIKLLRQHAMSINDRVRYVSKEVLFEDHIELGYNYRMTDIQAAVGIKQLEKLDEILEGRRKIAQTYIKELGDIATIQLPIEPENYRTNFQSFSIYLKPQCKISRNQLMQNLMECGISARRGVVCTHLETAYKEDYQDCNLPISEDIYSRSIIIPLYYPMTLDDINYIISKIKLFVS